jgi:hypothetical protein
MAAHRVARGQELAVAEIARDLCLAQAQVEIVLAAPADPTSLEAYRGRPKRARRPLRVGERPSPTPEDLAVETLFGKAAVRAGARPRYITAALAGGARRPLRARGPVA